MAERGILGTAGHIDHGKTTLIRSLTGVDCDRLPEEKSRGITIELGFAALPLPSGRTLGIVDVPGHERLVRTMVAGATGIDLVLLVVAADEGIMPQTREHLAICELLGVARGVVGLTKIDAVEPDLVELVRMEVEEELAASSLAEAPVIPVSAERGDGLADLVAALDAVASGATRRSTHDGPAWLPVDRVFHVRGFGTVVTGTLRGADFREGDAVEVFPERASSPFETKIRGLQVHGESAARVGPGSRCALNLQGVEVSAVPRGSVVATPARLAYRRRVDVELRLLGEAAPLASGSSWMVHVGTTERRARLRLLGGAELRPAQRAFAELRFARPLAAFEGDRFILRGFQRIPGAGWTVGGGRVLDAAPLPGRRALADRLADLELMREPESRAGLAARLRRAGLRGVREPELLREVLSVAGIEGVRIGADRWLDAGHFETLVSRCTRAVECHHREAPTEAWVGLAAVARRLPPSLPEEALRSALDAAARRGQLEAAGGGYRQPGHAAHAADPELARRALERLDAAGLAPDNADALARALGADPGQLRPVLDYLTREETLVRVAPGLFFARAAVDALRERLVAYLEAHAEIDPAAYKTLTGQTRKYTVPLMEFFDAEKLTLRRGNVRVLRARSS